MKRILKIVAVILVIGIGAFFYLRESQGMDMPTGQEGPAAEQLAQRILDACNVDAWDQTRYVQWTFAGSNSYLWDRTLGKVEVVSGDQRVILNTADRSGVAYDVGQQLQGEDAEEALTSAWA
ncbi:MAG: hypothetical protein HKN79_04345, partial [Flavobacteriales bacterium]|nr:hypothetical protein [Flavobacteriales bacterium]